MTASFRFSIYRERGVFELSAICIQGVVPVRMQGRLVATTYDNLEIYQALASDQSLPHPPSQAVTGQLRKLVERSSLRAFAFYPAVVVGNGLRRLASGNSSRSAQPPLRPAHGLRVNSRGPLDRWSFISASLQACKQTSRRFTKCLASPFVFAAHGNNHRAGVRQGVAKDRQELVKHGQGHE